MLSFHVVSASCLGDPSLLSFCVVPSRCPGEATGERGCEKMECDAGCAAGCDSSMLLRRVNGIGRLVEEEDMAEDMLLSVGAHPLPSSGFGVRWPGEAAMAEGSV